MVQGFIGIACFPYGQLPSVDVDKHHDGRWGCPTSMKYKVERDERYLPYIELGRWLCSHFQLETQLNFLKPLTQKLYNLEK